MFEFPRHRFRPVLVSVSIYLVLATVLRVVLAIGHHPVSPVGLPTYAAAFVSGFGQDLTVAMVLFTPMALFRLAVDGQWRSSRFSMNSRAGSTRWPSTT
jgi:hypothetical protein